VAYLYFRSGLGVICFATSSVAENEEHDRRQRAPEERYPKPKPALPRARAISVATGIDATKTMKMKIDHASI
jgi:hypothetical protein